MKEHIRDIELIEKFLDGKMTYEEKKQFDARRAHDNDFNAILKDMDLLVEGIKTSASKTSNEEKMERLRFYAEITSMEEDAEKGSESFTRAFPMYRRPSVLAIAASIVLLVTVGWIYMANQKPNSEKLFLTYFEPFDSPGSGLTRGNNELSLKAQAYDAYDNGRFEEAIGLFNEIIANSNDPIIHLCLGNAQMKLGRFSQAEDTFNHLLTEHSDLVTQAKWYLALTYLKENKMERAKATLWEITKSSTYGEKAQKLLKELD